VRDQRWPEIVAVQEMQQNQARLMFKPADWRSRIVNRLLPFLMRTGLLARLQSKAYRLMSEGVVPVKLMV
jgi:hypothetical protein